MEKIALAITPTDICQAQHFELSPLVYALVQSTNTLWRISECGTAVEVLAPFRSFVLPDDVLELWHQWQQTGCVPPHAFQVECQRLVPSAEKASVD